MKSKLIGFLSLAMLVLLASSFTLLFHSFHSPTPLLPPTEYEEYKQEWKTVDSLVNKGLPQSALTLVEELYVRSKTEDNHPQYIKSTLYKIKLQASFQEEFIEKTVNELEQEIAISETPVKQILHSIISDMYWRYYQANRYKFLDRSTIINVDMDDMQTWDLKTMLYEIIKNYQASLADKDQLMVTNLKEYNVILETTKESKKYRPTLYDFLAHRAVDFFMNDESSIIQPADRFELNDAEYFAKALDFSKLNLQTNDSLSLKFYAIQILQDLTAFHLNDEEPTALIDMDLKRLNFVYQNTTLPEKDSLYLTTLQNLEQLTSVYPSSTDVSYEIARLYHLQAMKYKPLESDNNKWENKKAHEKCKEAIDRFSDSDGAKNCLTLLNQIEKPDLRISMEKINVSEKPFLSLVKYKNTPELFVRIIQIPYEEFRTMEQDYRVRIELLKKYVSYSPFKSWELELPADGDFQNHRTEIGMPALQLGHYILLAGNREDFDVDSCFISYNSFWISNISYIVQKSTEAAHRFFVLDRTKGTALKNVKAQIIHREYSYQSRTYEYIQGDSFLSDDNGYFEIPALETNNKRNSFIIEFTNNNDVLVTDKQFYRTGYVPKQEKAHTRTWFFTDRAIYRPGQTIYFKGIVLEQSGEDYSIKEKFKTVVEFKDVNYQKISEVELVTNEYGSFNGSFTAPKGVLNGRMTIKNGSGSVTVKVEEYKRPTFEVVFNPIKGSYKLNEKVYITGNAKAFAGNVIDNANVKYRVVRQTLYPWRYWRYSSFPGTPSMEITNGTATTNEDGEFVFDFTAIPDQTVLKKYKPMYSYRIYVDVTDLNGETQSSTTSVNVSYVALQVHLDINDITDKEKLNTVKISTTNLNGEPEPVSGKITVSKLQEPTRLIRDKLWNIPDVFTISEEAYKNEYPFDDYKQEHQLNKLNVESVVSELDFNTETDSTITFSEVKKWESGRYSIIVETKDSYGEKVELTKYITLYSPNDKKPPVHEINWFHVLKDNGEPGENAQFIIGTKEKSVSVLYEIVHKNDVISRQWLKLSDEQRLIEVPIEEAYRGGFSVNLLFTRHNRSFNNSFRIDVPHTNKKLDFEYITFRDKLIPGSEEQWKIKIKGKQGDQVAAELLASMYDASLDKLTIQNWNFNLYRNAISSLYWNSSISQGTYMSNLYVPYTKPGYSIFKEYDRLNWFGFNYYGGGPFIRKGITSEAVLQMDGIAMPGQAQLAGMDQTEGIKMKGENESSIPPPESPDELISEKPFDGIQVRRDFRETAFFYPSLFTDENGDVEIAFTIPESLTKWKLMGLAHTKDLKYGQFQKEIVTQKDLMIIPNVPRFFREGDQISFTAKIVNLSEEKVIGEAFIQFFDTRTMEDITEQLLPNNSAKAFEVSKGASDIVDWDIQIPDNVDVISYKVMAKAGNFTDGEEKAIPVLSNRMLVTESMPLPVKGNETKSFKFEKLLNADKRKSTIKHHKLTLEFSSNPTWYAVQALPYMMEAGYESADNIFNRYYANSIASYLVNSSPKIRQVFEVWSNYSPDALLSNLEKNEELKSLILQETPWVLDAENETEQKKRIALFFDLNRMSDELNAALRNLIQKQSPNGGWPWFKGMPESRYITQNIVTGFGHLKQLGVYDEQSNEDVKKMLRKAVRYLDQRIKEDFDKLKKSYPDDMDKIHLSRTHIQYLYARSYFLDEFEISKSCTDAFNYYREQAKKYWTKQNIYLKGMTALALNKLGVKSLPSEIMASIKEYALYSDEMGMYWRDNRGGYYWYEAPIETQALLIEAFGEVTADKEAVEQMKIWLLKQKQTQNWKTGKATAEAVYALMLRGSDWLVNDKLAEIRLGKEIIDPFSLEETKVEAGTGYFKTSWTGGEIESDMGNITVTNKNPNIAWGAVYWQYFEDLDKITTHETPLQLEKKLFVEKNTDAGPVIELIEEDQELQVGDKLKVRIELRVDRDMEYVHMKDMRASAFEPINVLSGYRYHGGLGYYESTLDASTNFFFDYLRKGTYVFEYPLVVSQKGDFSNGITTIQCMYAPEYTSHSEGVRVVVE
ncbi:MAG: hypothetical protein K8R74_13865 [Bacteroidales bacterium]|nr:hypothetical protein [Bacteroidales bacterium]